MTIEVGKYQIFGMYPYFFFSVLGLAVSISCYLFLLLMSNVHISKKNLLLCLFTVVGVFLGARFFGCITNIAILLYKNEKIGLDVIYKAGLVFYGGLIGGVCFYLIGMRFLFQACYYPSLTNSLAVCIPLFHFFGRLGCLFAGCCYGIEYHGFGHIVYVRNGVPLETFPVQLVESIIEIIIFLLLLLRYCVLTRKERNNMLLIYFMVYSICRFFIEFLRGDPNRGFFSFLSFSQIISIIVLVATIIIYFRKRGKYENN